MAVACLCVLVRGMSGWISVCVDGVGVVAGYQGLGGVKLVRGCCV